MSVLAVVKRIVALFVSAAVSGGELAAQQPDTSRLLRGTTVGVALDRLVSEGGAGVTAVSLRVTNLNPGEVGADFAIGTYLPALQEGVLVFGMDLGPAYNLAGSGGTGLLKIGGSTVVAMAGQGAGALFGGYVGGGLVTRVGPRLGVRVDVAKRIYFAAFGDDGSFGIWTLSLGLTSLRRER